MTTIADVVRYLDETFHPEYQEDYDNSGFLVGDGAEEYRGALVALDLTEEVLAEAKACRLNLIVTHHPLIFSGVKRITDSTAIGRLLMNLMQSHMAVYAAHTNLDNLPWGVSGVLAEKLELENRRVLSPLGADTGAGIIGDLRQPREIQSVLLEVKSLLKAPVIRTTPYDTHTLVRRIAVCGGSGSPFIGDALAAGADLYLTADLKYHDFQRGEGRIILADAGHYETEQFAKEIISRTISEKFSNFANRISETQGSIVSYI